MDTASATAREFLVYSLQNSFLIYLTVLSLLAIIHYTPILNCLTYALDATITL